MKLVIELADNLKKQIDDGKAEELGIPLWLAYSIANGTTLNEIRAKIAAKIGGNGSENDGLDKALAIIDEYIRERQK